ncbi:MAG: PEP-utilizing enzyme [Halobacteriales archaeon]
MSQGEERFPWPEELDTPSGLEGWEDMYPEHMLFNREGREDYDKQFFWYQDKIHAAEALYPWETIFQEAWQIALSQNNSRVFAIPPAMGVQQRMLNGYLYISPVPCTDPELLEEREEIFGERSDYYFENFDGLYYGQWKPKVRDLGEDIKDLDIPEEFPKYVPEERVIQGDGYTMTAEVMEAYNELVDQTLRGWQYHFEFLNLAYLAYLTFSDFCQEAFPGISDDAIGKLVSAMEETDMYKPEEKLNDLARLAVDLGDDVTSVLKADADPQEKLDRLEGTEAGREWLEAFHDVEDPWFYVSNGSGWFHHEGAWIDDYASPFEHLESKVRRAEQGEEIDRPYEQLEQERKELAEEYRGYLDTEEDREAFEDIYSTTRRIYTYAEDHQFWIEHWLHTIVFEKMREFGRLLVNEDALEAPDDIFLFNRFEVPEMLEEVCTAWALGPDAPVSDAWKRKAEERQDILEAARDWDVEPALGNPPEQIEEPFTVMLWGITTEKVEGWLSAEAGEQLTVEGFPASRGDVEGPARVIESLDQLHELEDGEILVCPSTNPSWAPVFPRIQAAVTDIGGLTSHAAIVCREYGLPAVTGTGVATSAIETGDTVRVSGSEGEVEIVEKAGAAD